MPRSGGEKPKLEGFYLFKRKDVIAVIVLKLAPVIEMLSINVFNNEVIRV